jgi:hypothetical protein
MTDAKASATLETEPACAPIHRLSARPLVALSRHAQCADECPVLGDVDLPLLTKVDLGAHALASDYRPRAHRPHVH